MTAPDRVFTQTGVKSVLTAGRRGIGRARTPGHRNVYKRWWFSLIIVLTFSASQLAEAAEFAFLASAKAIQSKGQGTGRSLGVYYGGFGLLAGLELKRFRQETYPSANLRLILGRATVEMGLNKHGPSFRGGASFPLIKHFGGGNSPLYANMGFEHSFGNNEYSGLYVGLDLFILN
jgi:hypothetical protein